MPALLQRAEDIADEIHVRLARCMIAQGAETDLGRVTFRGRRKVDDTMLPCCSLIEGDDIPSRETRSTYYELSQRYVVFAYLPCDPNDPNVAAHKGIRDLKRAIFRTDGKASVTWGGRVKEVAYLGRDIGPRADGAAFVIAAIEFAVTFVEDVANP